MDTRFWGPSGWRFLHMIAFSYQPEKDRKNIQEFFELLPFVLPCKYCRSNLVEHYEGLPLEPALESRQKLTRWLYDIHNRVNAKLRTQGFKVADDPPFDAVRSHYEERLAYGCSKTFFPGWEFLFSIVESHPLQKQKPIQPLPQAPPRDSIDSSDTLSLLRWNYLSNAERYIKITRFWKVLPSILPFAEWRTLWKESGPSTFPRTKQAAFISLWATRKRIEDELDLLNKTNYYDLCKMIRYYKSGCAYSKRPSKTCRRLRTSTRKRKEK